MTFEDDRLASIQTQITAIEAAIIAITTDGAQSYTLDTGQSRTTVTKVNLPEIINSYEQLIILYNSMNKRINGKQLILRGYK